MGEAGAAARNRGIGVATYGISRIAFARASTAGSVLAIEFGDLLHFLAAGRADVHSGLVGFGQEQRILHGGVESATQRGDALAWRLGRSDESAGNAGIGRQEGQNLAVVLVLGKLGHQRHIGQLRMPSQRDLHQNEDLLLGEPVRLGRLPRCPRIRAASAHLAALHREVDVVAAGIAGDDPELRADQRVHRLGIVDRAGGGAGRADHELPLHHVADRPNAGGVPGIHHVRAVGGVADPEEVAGIELDLAAAKRLMRGHVLHDGVQHGAVARRLRGEPVGRLQADRAGHVAGDDRRLARNVPADMARNEPCAQVVVAAGRGRDQHGQGLAAIEIRHRVRGRRQRQHEQHGQR